MNVLGGVFLNSRRDERKEFFVRCRRTYVLKNMYFTEIFKRIEYLYLEVINKENSISRKYETIMNIRL